jgi:organic radical activating enzyme
MEEKSQDREHTELLFKWFEKHLHKLHKIMVLGGEPFLQKGDLQVHRVP